MTQEKWPIRDVGDFGVVKVLPAGRYKCILTRIKATTAPVYQKPDEIEDRLMFVFEPIGIQKKDEESCYISTSVRPSNSPKSKMYKLLCGMAKDGTIPEGIRKDTELYQAFAEDLIGKTFMVTSEPSKNGRYNNTNSAIWSEVQEKWNKPERKEQPEQTKTIVTPKIVRWYDISPLLKDKVKLEKAKQLLGAAAAEEKAPNVWMSEKEIISLKNYITTTPVAFDEMPEFNADSDIPF